MIDNVLFVLDMQCNFMSVEEIGVESLFSDNGEQMFEVI